MTARVPAYLLLFTLVPATLLAQASPPAEPPRGGADRAVFSVSVEDEAFQPGHPVVVRVTVRNLTDTPFFVIASPGIESVRFSMFDQNGDSVSRTAFGQQRIEIPSTGSNLEIASVEPGETYSYQMLVNRLFDLTVEGRYVLTALLTLNEGGEVVEFSAQEVPIRIEAQETTAVEEPLLALLFAEEAGSRLEAMQRVTEHAKILRQDQNLIFDIGVLAISGRPEVRQAALYCLWILQVQEAEEAFVHALAAEDPQSRLYAAMGLLALRPLTPSHDAEALDVLHDLIQTEPQQLLEDTTRADIATAALQQFIAAANQANLEFPTPPGSSQPRSDREAAPATANAVQQYQRKVETWFQANRTQILHALSDRSGITSDISAPWASGTP